MRESWENNVLTETFTGIWAYVVRKAGDFEAGLYRKDEDFIDTGVEGKT